jgi:hypothetical protein
LTVVVLSCWALYMRHSREHLGQGHSVAFRAGLEIV